MLFGAEQLGHSGGYVSFALKKQTPRWMEANLKATDLRDESSESEPKESSYGH